MYFTLILKEAYNVPVLYRILANNKQSIYNQTLYNTNTCSKISLFFPPQISQNSQSNVFPT